MTRPYDQLCYHPTTPVFETARTAEKCRRSLWEFTRRAWPSVDPAPFIDNWHIGAICEHLEAVTKKQIQKLIINCPPGVAKSTLVSVMWPAWEWIDNPGEQSLFGSYDINLSMRDSVKCRTVFDSSWYKHTFEPDWRLRKDQNAKGFYVNTSGGNRYTFGMLAGGQTGWRGNKVVLDDPNNVKHRYDPRIKKQTYDIFNNVLSSRVNDIVYSSFVVIQQRMATDDMTGLLLEENEDESSPFSLVNESIPFEWVHLKLPMVATSRPCTTIIKWSDPRKEGEPLFPTKFPQSAIDYMRTKKLGEDGYASQYQQEPVPAGGSRFNKSDFLHWYNQGRGVAILVRRGGIKEYINLNLCWTFVTTDLAASEKKQADFTVFSTWAVTQKYDLLLMDRRRGQWAEPEIIRNAVEIYSEKYYNEARHLCFVVEDNGLGLPICQAMQARGLPVLPVHIHRTDKYVRTATAAIRIQAGQIFWPDPATPWYNDPKEGWEIEHLRFPAHPNDDQVDTTSLAAEAVYEAGIGVLTEADVVEPEIKDFVKQLYGRNPQTPQFKATAKKFFGHR